MRRGPEPSRCRAPRATVVLALWALGCGGSGDRLTLDDCIRRHTAPAEESLLPTCVWTDRGALVTESTYVAGVVDCELGGVRGAPAALEAQAIAARTYLARHLARQGDDALVRTSPRFQCWRPSARPHAVAAAEATRDVVMHRGGSLITANYVAGARALRADCTPASPEANGYDAASWDAMRRAYQDARAHRRRVPFSGAAWTEVVVTRNAGRWGEDVLPTPMGRAGPANRGAMGQNAAVCLALKGHDADAILRYFYGDDVDVFRPMHPALEDLRVPADDLPEASPRQTSR